MKPSQLKRFLLYSGLLFFFLISLPAQQSFRDCRIDFKDGILTLENNRIAIAFDWNEGDISLGQITNKTSGHTWNSPEGKPMGINPAELNSVPDANLDILPVKDHDIYPDHLSAVITVKYPCFEVKRRYRIFPETGALSMSLSIRKNCGEINSKDVYFDECVTLPGRQWKFESVELFDRTDVNNNLVDKRVSLSYYKPLDLRGNILIATDQIHDERLFIIKESPLGENQLLYPGYDFRVAGGEITIKNLGALYPEVSENQWYRCYGYVIGTGGGSEFENLVAMRDYMKHSRRDEDGSQEMIMLNTWGDRGQDGRIGEEFALNELKFGERLGITHFQLDDGWQQGLSKNSKSASGNLWDQWSREDWEPHDTRFPSGLSTVVKDASKRDIRMGLWFHPSNANSYENWDVDSEIILKLYRDWGIKTFKIDGIMITDKNADINLRRFFDTISIASKGDIIFNVDATAGQRGGYFYLTEYGNIFLENRYSDWGNYYPHWTLRNLWMLSEYVPAEMLQIEFLNNTRNKDKYIEADPYRPSAIPFDYVFAVTMAGQPLAWMETSNLPEEAFKIKGLVEDYKKIMKDFHSGHIFPVGAMPDGKSWTGFQSISDAQSGYLLIYRENSENGSCKISTRLSSGRRIILEKVLGYGEGFDYMTGDDGEIAFSLPGRYTFALYRYRLQSTR